MQASRAQGVRGARGGPRAGFTLLELAIVMLVLTVGVALFSSTLVSTSRWAPAAQQISLASEAARRQLEILRSEPFGRVFALYNADPYDDPEGPATAPGPHFAVPGLQPMPDDPDGLAGEVVFASPGPHLREDVESPPLGMPRDLDADSLIDDLDHSGDYVVLPVLVRIRWREPGGAARIYELHTMLADLEGAR